MEPILAHLLLLPININFDFEIFKVIWFTFSQPVTVFKLAFRLLWRSSTHVCAQFIAALSAYSVILLLLRELGRSKRY